MIEWEQLPDAGHYGRLALFVCPVCAAVVGERCGDDAGNGTRGEPLGSDARDKHAEWHGSSG